MKRVVITAAVRQKTKIAQVVRDLGVSRSWASEPGSASSRNAGLIAVLETQDALTAACSLRRTLKMIADRIIPVRSCIRAGKIMLGPYDEEASSEFMWA